VRQVLFASEEPHERPALHGCRVAKRSSEHRVGRLQGVEDEALGGGAVDAKLDLPPYACESAQVVRQDHADHGIA
jgi:hypothetical protein